mmetsp:Transcript_34796/g.53364  ORF Transcript_34796/g.53364 Transcript_34796/m.53364 type:complete len:111 (+) Transcript_34796:130-462(+)|eukprot:CAMPEP_0118672862 /NCGR_PEP_ID=MMETSP0800-20121206/4_1 /TAXON_ID=210618 ORGANISM="Striatella unipunctata, Strain CCMP2910" /NCGR_SAMPLE_ID=MMETSP0800 /ASSEMBLY_ACC=CAM_ASM_000638 /LENGTH=110 /DNA_ID=CAMNT_0006567865 /DNA_START=98 /DNA_END=430 /DNA_ORIENTATION=-
MEQASQVSFLNGSQRAASSVFGGDDRIGGALCNDSNGLCVGAKGEIDDKDSGIYTSIVRMAAQLEPDDVPVVAMETDEAHILVKEFDGHTVVLRIPLNTDQVQNAGDSRS